MPSDELFWRPSMEDANSEAKQSRKPVFVDLWEPT